MSRHRAAELADEINERMYQQIPEDQRVRKEVAYGAFTHLADAAHYTNNEVRIINARAVANYYTITVKILSSGTRTRRAHETFKGSSRSNVIRQALDWAKHYNSRK